jgi:hypothetical protein
MLFSAEYWLLLPESNTLHPYKNKNKKITPNAAGEKDKLSQFV